MRLAPFRAAARVAWRQAWRAKARSALVVATVALPIGGLCSAAIAIRTATESPQERASAVMGSADLLVYPSNGLDAAGVAALLPNGSIVAERRSAYTETTVGGSFVQVFLTGASPLDASTWLRVSLVRTGQGFFLNWNPQPGFIYQVQFSPDLRTWINLGNPRFAGGDTDSIFVGGSDHGFYHVLQLR